MIRFNLLSDGATNAKQAKGLHHYPHLHPFNLSLASAERGSIRAGQTVCPQATGACKAACIDHTAGHGTRQSVQDARIRKTHLFWTNRQDFMKLLREDIASAQKWCHKRAKTAAFRLDNFSDLGLASKVADLFPESVFWDYTKIDSRYSKWLANRNNPHKPPFRLSAPNLHLTFSYSGEDINGAYSLKFLADGGTVARVVDEDIKSQILSQNEWNGYPTIDGDVSDYRWLDKPGHWVILRAKGSQRNNSRIGRFVYR